MNRTAIFLMGSRYAKLLVCTSLLEKHELANENLYAAEYLGSGTFIIRKPKRKSGKLRQSRLKGRRRGSRK
jgi:hypothetical protein